MSFIWSLVKLIFYAAIGYILYIIYTVIGWQWSLLWLFAIAMIVAMVMSMKVQNEQN